MEDTSQHWQLCGHNNNFNSVNIPVTTANLSEDVIHFTTRDRIASDLKESDGSSMNCAERLPNVSNAS
jgi:hypothetical protein